VEFGYFEFQIYVGVENRYFVMPESFWYFNTMQHFNRLNTLVCAEQGCQIFLGTTYQNGEKSTNDRKIFQMDTKYTK
jgi:hypothetical protein